MPLLPHADYYYDLTGTNAYVLLNGSPELVRKVVGFFEDNEIKVTGTGASRYPARSGAQYAWFMRVATVQGEKPQPEAVHSLLKKFNPDNHPDFERLQTQTRELQKSLDVLKQKQTEAESRLSVRESELERIRKNNEELSAKQAQIEMTAEERRSQARQLEQEVQLLREERESLKSEVQSSREFVDQFSADFDEREKALNILQQQYESVCAERDSLRQQVSEVSELPDSLGERRTSSAEQLICDMFKGIMPDVEFLKGSIELIATYLADPAVAIQRIRQVVFDKQNGTSVRAAKGWSEMRFSTGQDDSGRIYFRRIKECGYQILVSLKENQEHDIDYLKRQ